MSDPVSSPSHYTAGGIETIDAIEAWSLGFHLGNVVKYVSRAGKKDPSRTVEDLRKARWYLERAIARAEAAELAAPRIIVTPHRLTDEEAERIREQWRAVHAGGTSPIVLPTLEQEPPAVRHYGPGSPHAYFADALASFAGSSAARQRLREHQRWDQQHAVATTGYSEDNRAEALHPPQGDA